MAAKLTPKQERFVAEYPKDLNASAAARRAGYSERRCAEIAYENLRKPQIQEALAAALEARNERVRITADEVLRMLKREAARTGEGASHGARVRATELLGKHLGMFNDKLQVEHSGEIGRPLNVNVQYTAPHTNGARAPSPRVTPPINR